MYISAEILENFCIYIYIDMYNIHMYDLSIYVGMYLNTIRML